jgi:hypothetical protein
MAWTVILVDEVTDWFFGLVHQEPETAESVSVAINQLESYGPSLGRPLVDSIAGSSVHNMKELRPAREGAARFASSLSLIRPDRRYCWWPGTKQETGLAGIAKTFHSRKSAMHDGLLVTMPRNEVCDGAKLEGCPG